MASSCTILCEFLSFSISVNSKYSVLPIWYFSTWRVCEWVWGKFETMDGRVHPSSARSSPLENQIAGTWSEELQSKTGWSRWGRESNKFSFFTIYFYAFAYKSIISWLYDWWNGALQKYKRAGPKIWISYILFSKSDKINNFNSYKEWQSTKTNKNPPSSIAAPAERKIKRKKSTLISPKKIHNLSSQLHKLSNSRGKK